MPHTTTYDLVARALENRGVTPEDAATVVNEHREYIIGKRCDGLTVTAIAQKLYDRCFTLAKYRTN